MSARNVIIKAQNGWEDVRNVEIGIPFRKKHTSKNNQKKPLPLPRADIPCLQEQPAILNRTL